jgi:hypothetical protein
VVKKLERPEMAWLRIFTGSLFEWASPTQEQRLQSGFHEVIDYRGIQDAWPFPSDALLRMDYGLVEASWGLRYIIGFVLSS